MTKDIMSRLQNERFLLDLIVAGNISITNARKVLAYIELAGCDIQTAIEKLEINTNDENLVEPLPELYPLFSTPDPELGFDNFIQCPENEFACEIARSIVGNESGCVSYNPLYLYGPIGVGKTHLLSAVFNSNPAESIFITTSELGKIYSKHKNSSFYITDFITSHKFICIDDIQLFDSNDFLQNELFTILNKALTEKTGIIITSDVPPTRLKGIENRLISRLGAGVIANLGMGDAAWKRRIIDLMDTQNIIPAEVSDFISNHIFDNVRHLKSVITQLLAISRKMNVAITIETARSLAPTGHDLNNSPGFRDLQNRKNTSERRVAKERFIHMLQSAETIEEQQLAIEIAINDRLRELREAGNLNEEYEKLKKSINYIHTGELGKAMELFQI